MARRYRELPDKHTEYLRAVTIMVREYNSLFLPREGSY